MKLFLDTNVIIDFLGRREPFAADIAQVFVLAEKGHVVLYASAISFSTCYYILRRRFGTRDTARLAVNNLERLVFVAPATQAIIRRAIDSSFEDFEDGIQNYCAVNVPVDFIISRNVKDIVSSEISVIEPGDFLNHFYNEK